MGNANDKKLAVCPSCSTELDLTSIQRTTHNLICGRCRSSIQKVSPKQTRFSRVSSFLSQPHNVIECNHDRLMPLKYVQIGTFCNDADIDAADAAAADNKNENDEKTSPNHHHHHRVSEDYILEHCIRPFFLQSSSSSADGNPPVPHPIAISAAHRFVLHDLEFKVLKCYPFQGFIDADTCIDLYRDDNRHELFRLHRRNLHQLHVLPTMSSLSATSKKRRQRHLNRNEIFVTHLRPYLSGNDEAFFLNATHGLQSANLGHRHLAQGEFFRHGGVEWMVHKCQPNDGFVTRQTTVYCNGAAIADLTDLQIRPIVDTLPIEQQTWTPAQLQHFYLHSNSVRFFAKLFFKCVDREEMAQMQANDAQGLRVDSVRFAMHCPTAAAEEHGLGIITCATRIDMTPISDAEMRHISDQRDLEFARRLQQQEYERILGGMNQMMLYRAMTELQQRREQQQQRREQQQQQQQNNNDNGGGGEVPQQPQQQLSAFEQYPMYVGGPLASFAQITAHLQDIQNMDQLRRQPLGLNQALINTLPTYKYSIKPTRKNALLSKTKKEEATPETQAQLQSVKEEHEQDLEHEQEQLQEREVVSSDVHLQSEKCEDDNGGDGVDGGAKLQIAKDVSTIEVETGNEDEEEEDEGYTVTCTKGSVGRDEDYLSCRICLEEYDEGDEIRILPCLHQYHKMCIDHWLRHSVKCPICNTSIFD